MSVPDEITRFQSTLDALHVKYADALRRAVADFNAEPVTPASVDWFRARVLALADILAEPMLPGHSRKVEIAPGVFVAADVPVREPLRAVEDLTLVDILDAS